MIPSVILFTYEEVKKGNNMLWLKSFRINWIYCSVSQTKLKRCLRRDVESAWVVSRRYGKVKMMMTSDDGNNWEVMFLKAWSTHRLVVYEHLLEWQKVTERQQYLKHFAIQLISSHPASQTRLGTLCFVHTNYPLENKLLTTQRISQLTIAMFWPSPHYVVQVMGHFCMIKAVGTQSFEQMCSNVANSVVCGNNRQNCRCCPHHIQSPHIYY